MNFALIEDPAIADPLDTDGDVRGRLLVVAARVLELVPSRVPVLLLLLLASAVAVPPPRRIGGRGAGLRAGSHIPVVTRGEGQGPLRRPRRGIVLDGDPVRL